MHTLVLMTTKVAAFISCAPEIPVKSIRPKQLTLALFPTEIFFCTCTDLLELLNEFNRLAPAAAKEENEALAWPGIVRKF